MSAMKRLETGDGARTYWEPRIESWATTVMPGDHYVTTRSDLAIVTLLGSCVAACIRDVDSGIGGLNHFLLPDDKSERDSGGRSARYGTHAMEVLINDILKLGGSRGRMEAKVFGGANVIEASNDDTVGRRNGQFVTEYLRREGIKIAASDLGGERARRVFFFPATGKVRVLKPQSAESAQIREAERKLRAAAAAIPAGGGVELFV